MSKKLVALATCALCLVAAQSAQAGFTPVGPDGPSTLEIINQLYGGGFSGDQWGGLSYSNGGGISLTRIQDTGTPNDQVWSFGSGTLTADARFGGNDSAGLVFGYLDTPNSTNSVPLFTLGGSGYAVTGHGTANSADAIGFSTNGSSGSFYSNMAFNPLGIDQMISYEVNGLNNGGSNWLLFWELQGSHMMTDEAGATRICGSDRDFNDFVVQIGHQGGGMNVVPAPAAGLLAAIGISAFAVRRRKVSAV